MQATVVNYDQITYDQNKLIKLKTEPFHLFQPNMFLNSIIRLTTSDCNTVDRYVSVLFLSHYLHTLN